MKLDKSQLIQIRDFISRRGFTYYDVQLEILDHVACRVEELMTADNTLTLDAAITRTHAEFGPLGFSAFEDAMRTSIGRKYWRMFKEGFAKYWGLKYLPLIIGFVVLFYWFSIAVNKPLVFINLGRAVTIGAFVIYLAANFNYKRGKKQMLSAHFNNMTVVMLNVPLQLSNMANTVFKDSVHLTAGATGIILGVVIVLTTTSLLTLKQIAQITKAQSLKLEQQYWITVG